MRIFLWKIEHRNHLLVHVCRFKISIWRIMPTLCKQKNILNRDLFNATVQASSIPHPPPPPHLPNRLLKRFKPRNVKHFNFNVRFNEPSECDCIGNETPIPFLLFLLPPELNSFFCSQQLNYLVLFFRKVWLFDYKLGRRLFLTSEIRTLVSAVG